MSEPSALKSFFVMDEAEAAKRADRKGAPWGLLVLIALVTALCGYLFGIFIQHRMQLRALENYYNNNFNNIAVLDISGDMMLEGTAGDNGGYDHNYLLEAIDELIGDSSNKGLLLNINSGGGQVQCAAELPAAVQEYRDATGRPVYAFGDEYAASAAYWVASTADSIWLDAYCITGSIGVTFGSMIDLSGLLERYGVRINTIDSGNMKSMGSNLVEMSEEQRAVYQSIVDEYYGYFIDWVSEHRAMERETLLPLADGRIYTATQAQANGLSDEVGSYSDCLDTLADELGLEAGEFRVKLLTPPQDEQSLIASLLSAAQRTEQDALLELLPLTGAVSYYKP